MRLIDHPDTESELIEAARYYEGRDATLSIAVYYYSNFPDHLHILAFKHHRRHPDYWRYRISE